MSDGFRDLIDRSNVFFAQLAANNTKEWFEPHKETYTTQIKKPAAFLGELLAEDLSRATGVSHKAKLFRIHRDVRFSKDKTPFNTHLHLSWSQPREGKPAWFFGSSTTYLIFGMGITGFDSAALTRYRAFVDSHGDDLSDAIETAQASVGAEISDWGPAPLKRVPKPYDSDHPHAELLKRKSLTVTAPFPTQWRDTGLLPNVAALCSALMPIWSLLNEDLG
jgi:uncharacterized protein (TIGR02453 family)